MSFIQVMLSHKEVLFSLAAVVLVLFIAVGLALAPTLARKWKQASARRKVKRAAQQAAELKRKRAAQAKSGQRKRAVVVANQQAEVVPSDVPVVAVEEAPTAAAPKPEVTAPAAVTPPAVTPPQPEAQPAQSEQAEDIQDILNAVFVDEESNSRYEVLLRDVDPISAEDLAEMATRVAAALRAAQQQAS